MPRITVNVSEDLEAWVEDEAERLDRSKAEMGGRCIELIHGEVGHINPKHADSELQQSDVDQELRQRLDDVEERLAELEAATPTDSPPEPAQDPNPSPQQETSHDATAPRETTPDAGGGDDGEQGRAGVPLRADSVRAQAEEAVQAAEVPGRAAGVERTRREALLWAWDYLREHEHAKSSEIANATFGAFWSESRLNYSSSSRYPGYNLWDNYLRNQLAELPGVEAPGRRGSDWFFDT